MSNTVDNAIALATKGFAVFPLGYKSKAPVTKNGCLNATTNPEEIRELFRGKGFFCNIGIEAARSGRLLLLDIDNKDGRDGFASLKRLENAYGPLPKTLTALTPNKGEHRYLVIPNGVECPNVKDHEKIGGGIEIKTNNAYLVAPPSSLKEGSYSWVDENTPIAECPMWLIELAQQAVEKEAPSNIQLPVIQEDTEFEYDAKQVAERFNQQNPILDTLKSFGYLDQGNGFMRHPNNDSQDSVHLLPNGTSYHFGARDPLNGKGGGKDNCCYTSFGVVTELRYGGDFKAAIKAISAQLGMNKRKGGTEPLVDDEIVDEKNPFDGPYPMNITPDCLPAGIWTIAERLAHELNEPVEMPHIWEAISMCGAIIGKKAVWSNGGNDYRLNLAIAILKGTGGNKSGHHSVVRKTVDNFVNYTTPTTSTIESFVDLRGHKLKLRGAELAAEKRRLRKMEENNPTDNGEYLIIDEFRAYMTTMIRPLEAQRTGQIFCSIVDSTLPIETDTKMGGQVIIPDPCYNFLGFSQTDPWNSEMRTAMFQKGGMAARFIPVNTEQMYLNGYEPFTDQMADVVLHKIKEMGNQQDRPMRIVFKGDGDVIGTAKEQFKTNPKVQFVAERMPAPFGALENKILVQAGKVAAILAYCDYCCSRQEDIEGFTSVSPPDPLPVSLDAEPWLFIAYYLVGFAHLTNLFHVEKITEQGELMDKITMYVERKGAKGCTVREIVRGTDMLTRDVQTYVALLVADGILTSKPERKTTKFFKAKRKAG